MSSTEYAAQLAYVARQQDAATPWRPRTTYTTTEGH